METNQMPSGTNKDGENKKDVAGNRSHNQPTESELRFGRGTETDPFAASKEKEFSSAKHEGNDIANNDGSVFETLDTAFHDKPGHAEGESASGSNRADYYEERSYGKSDDEEELDAHDDEKS